GSSAGSMALAQRTLRARRSLRPTRRPPARGQTAPPGNAAAGGLPLSAGVGGLSMNGLTEWTRDVLLSRGALVESEDCERLRALLPAEVAASLETGEWLSLNFDGRAGSDEASDWMERLARLLPARCLVAGVRLRRLAAVPSIDASAVLAGELVVQN